MHPFNFFYLSEAALTSPLAGFIDAGEAVEIIKDGKPVAVLLPVDEYERLKDDLDAAQLRSIEARNPGIDMDDVRRIRSDSA